MNIRDMYPKKYASGEDLEGRAVNVTISGISKERMTPPGSAPVEKYVIFFRETQRGVVLSRILAEQIATITGFDDTDKWPGQVVTLYPESITVAGKKRVVIRARAAAGPSLPRTAYTISTDKEAE